MTYENRFLAIKEGLVKDGVFSSSGVSDEQWAVYKADNKAIEAFNGKKVAIKSINEGILGGNIVQREGKIKMARVNAKGDMRPMFYPGRNRTRGYWLDSGLLKGCYATLVPLTITELN